MCPTGIDSAKCVIVNRLQNLKHMGNAGMTNKLLIHKTIK